MPLLVTLLYLEGGQFVCPPFDTDDLHSMLACLHAQATCLQCSVSLPILVPIVLVLWMVFFEGAIGLDSALHQQFVDDYPATFVSLEACAELHLERLREAELQGVLFGQLATGSVAD